MRSSCLPSGLGLPIRSQSKFMWIEGAFASSVTKNLFRASTFEESGWVPRTIRFLNHSFWFFGTFLTSFTTSAKICFCGSTYWLIIDSSISCTSLVTFYSFSLLSNDFLSLSVPSNFVVSAIILQRRSCI